MMAHLVYSRRDSHGLEQPLELDAREVADSDILRQTQLETLLHGFPHLLEFQWKKVLFVDRKRQDSWFQANRPMDQKQVQVLHLKIPACRDEPGKDR